MTTVQHILTHPGSAHKDDFLACSVLVHVHQVPVLRAEPTTADLDDPSICVVDVGGRHEPARNNFDHHQFPKDHPPICALSLVLQHLGIYEDALQFCDWLEPTEWFDSRGPDATAEWLGVDRGIMDRLMSPIDVTLLRRFSLARRHSFDDPLWHMMQYLGEGLLGFVRSFKQRLQFIRDHAEFWPLEGPHGPLRALFMPRTNPMPNEPSMALPRYIDENAEKGSVAVIIYPDRRGPGYGMSRHHDDPRVDFSRLTAHEDVHFAHARGFMAKTTAVDPTRLRELVVAAQVPA